MEYKQYIINNIYKVVVHVNGCETMWLYDCFVKEQVEEKKEAHDMIQKYELFGSDSKVFYELNQQIITMIYTTPTLIV